MDSGHHGLSGHEGILCFPIPSVTMLGVLSLYLFTVGSLLDQHPLSVSFILLCIWGTGESHSFGSERDSKEKSFARGISAELDQ